LKFLGWIFCLLLLAGCTAEEDSPEWVTVEHEQYNFSLDYPTKWVVDLYGDAGRKGNDDQKLVIMRKNNPILGLPSSPSTFIIIIEQRAFDNPTLQDVLNWGNEKIDTDLSQEGVQTKPGYEEFLFQEEEISGYAAIRRRYTYFNLGKATDRVIREEIYIPREDDMIMINLGIDEVYLHSFSSDFQRIVDSFRTIPSNEE